MGHASSWGMQEACMGHAASYVRNSIEESSFSELPWTSDLPLDQQNSK